MSKIEKEPTNSKGLQPTSDGLHLRAKKKRNIVSARPVERLHTVVMGKCHGLHTSQSTTPLADALGLRIKDLQKEA